MCDCIRNKGLGDWEIGIDIYTLICIKLIIRTCCKINKLIKFNLKKEIKEYIFENRKKKKQIRLQGVGMIAIILEGNTIRYFTRTDEIAHG